MLKRLSWLPDRDALDNGSVIGGQDYNDVYFNGGAAANLTLTDCTINGMITTPTVRIITDSQTVTALNTDNGIVVRGGAGGATTINLPGTPADNQFMVIKDANGDANVYNITIDGNGNTIDGGSTLIIGSAYGWNQLLWDGVGWNIIG